MRIILHYQLPVSVVVDLAEARVSKVVIHDDELGEQPSDVLDENGRSIVGTHLATAAKEIADSDSCWPSWQYV